MKPNFGVPYLGVAPLPLPSWLAQATAAKMLDEPFPLGEVLQESLFYPSCGSDGGPVRYLGKWINSFVYVDYGYSRQKFLDELAARPFVGYQVVGMRGVSFTELAPNGWRTPVLSSFEIRESNRYLKERVGQPFCEWVIFEREMSTPPSHGPERFSLLYMHADGADAYQSLYVGNDLCAKGIAVIQPGCGFGRNWTDFNDPQAVLARLVMGNPAGVPDFYLGGGIGPRKYLSPRWPEYSSLLGWYPYGGIGSVGVWERAK